jgi:hypothetical protein
MSLTHVTGGRMKPIGDINQIAAIEAGKPFEQQQKSALQFEIMRNIQRQKDPILKKAVLHAIDESVAGAFSILRTSPHADTGISNIEDEGKRLDAAITHYMRLVEEKVKDGSSLFDVTQHGVKIVTPLNRTKDALNTTVRDRLHESGQLDTSKQISMLRLLPKGITPTEQHQAIGFVPYKDNGNSATGDVIRFHSDLDEHGIKQGEYYQVQGATGTTLSLFNEAREHSVSLNMAVHTQDNLMTVFSASRKHVTIGEQLRWKDTYQTTDIRNGQSLEVIGIDAVSNSYKVRVDDGRQITIPNDFSGAHSDYNYAVTTNAVQGGTFDKTILVYDQSSKRIQSRNNIIVGLSRGVTGTHLYVDNHQKLATNADSNTLKKSSALDHLGKTGEYSRVEQPVHKRDVLEAHDGVNRAIAHLSGQFSSFSQYEIMRHAMRFSGQQAPPVKQAISELLEGKKLISVLTTDNHTPYFTTPDIVKQERALRGHITDTITTPPVSHRVIEKSALNLGLYDESAHALKNIFSGNHKVSFINTKVNSESTLLSHALLDITKSQHQQVLFISSGNHQQHSERLGVDVLSIPQFIKSQEKAGLVVMLDAHNASAKSFNNLFAKTDQLGCRVVVQGITALSQDFAHKHAFHHMAKNANPDTQLHDLLSNPVHDVDLLLKQTENSIATSVKNQLERDANIIQRKAERHTKMVEDYLKRPDSQNIISASKEGVLSITEKVREALKLKGEISNTSNVNTLQSVFMSPQQKHIASEYQIGQILIFNRKGEKDGFTRQETYVIEKIDSQNNRLTLVSASGSRSIDISEIKASGFSVAAAAKIEIGKGDLLRFDTGIFDQHIPQNSTGKVIGISQQHKSLSVELDSGRQVKLDLDTRAHQFISHGYVQSMNKASSTPMNRHALVELDGRFKSGANVQSFLKSLSNAKHSVALYADRQSTVHNYLTPSKDHDRSIEALLHKESQRASAQAYSHSNDHSQSRQQQPQHEHEHQHIQQRER